VAQRAKQWAIKKAMGINFKKRQIWGKVGIRRGRRREGKGEKGGKEEKKGEEREEERREMRVQVQDIDEEKRGKGGNRKLLIEL
jgi:hypothetical protein